MKLFLDANVLFTAAHNPHGKAAFVIELAREGTWEVVTSRLAEMEARRNLEAKFPDAVPVLDRVMTSVGIVPNIVEGRCPIDLPPKDVPIFLSAAGAGCTHLLTGDRKDFGRYMNAPQETSGIVIQSVGELLSSL